MSTRPYCTSIGNKEADKGKDEEANGEQGNTGEEKADTDGKKSDQAFGPQKKQFGSMLDYLEAKYVRGVVLDEDEDAEASDDDKRSLYSESSFLDDTQLKRDVAEQFLSHTTQTKLELENHDDDFFVNVGDLEVEDHDLMDYDPLDDDDDNSKKGANGAGGDGSGKKDKKKRKRPGPESGGGSAKKSKGPGKVGGGGGGMNSNKKPDGSKSGTKPAQRGPKKEVPILSEEEKKKIAVAKKKAQDLKTSADAKLQVCIEHIRDEMDDRDLPRKKKNEKVSIVVLAGRGPGDEITFGNPHNPGQKLCVKVPRTHRLAASLW